MTAKQTRDTAALYEVERGLPHPLGATPDQQGVNFSVFADRATGIELLLFDGHMVVEPFQVIQLDPNVNKSFHFWHVYVRGLKPGVHYAYRVTGQDDLHGRGDRYNPNKVLVDPYAKGTTDDLWDRKAACGPDDNLATSMRSVVIDLAGYDWEGDAPLKRPMRDSIIYEMHVRGFTKSPLSNVKNAGTFAGVIEKIPYLQSLGVTAVELLPIFGFDQKEVKQIAPDGTPLANYWGYDPISFFAPESSYCVSPEQGRHLSEFRDMVKALHKAGIEVILDVVFNHTSEGNEAGPTINFKGFANGVYYMLSPKDRQYYMDYTGCGNTVNGNHPITQKQILESLEYWVTEMHVDGFRFDEAVILCRDENGTPMVYPPVIWQIELSEALADTKIIAEAWDAAGLYEVGYFPGYRWGEWNGRYRDIIRRFVKGDDGEIDGKTLVGRVADVLAGSSDIFQSAGELPINSVNFVTAHDGFTLNDLVSYDEKHNEGNGQNNTDGINENLSWNCGVEGETDDPEIEALRLRLLKNFAAILLLSIGVPMILGGDEARRTQQGNNNAYCQDNEISWFDWKRAEANQELFRFFKQMIAFRKRQATLRRDQFFTGESNSRGLPDVTWHGCRLFSPGWDDPSSRVLAYTLGSFAEEDSPEDVDIHVILNMYWQDLDFDLPSIAGRQWHRVVDTSLPSSDDIAENFDDARPENRIDGTTYLAKNRSVVVLISRPMGK
jgi:glycogen operon protein